MPRKTQSISVTNIVFLGSSLSLIYEREQTRCDVLLMCFWTLERSVHIVTFCWCVTERWSVRYTLWRSADVLLNVGACGTHCDVLLMCFWALERALHIAASHHFFFFSSSIGATTLGGFWPALRFRSTIFYLYTSLSSFSLSSSLDPLLLGLTIPVFVFLLVLMSMVPIRLPF